MGRACKVCSSKNRVEYDKLYLNERWEVKDIWRHSKIKLKDDINYKSFLYHFRNHVQNLVDASVEASKLRNEKVKEEIYKAIDISKKLRGNIERIQEIIDKELEKDEKDFPYLLEVMREARQLYKLLLEYSEKLDLGPTIDKDSIYDKVIECLIESQIPDEYLYRFDQEWKKKEV